MEKIILKNKVNKIIKTYRNYHKKKDSSTINSTRNNTDRVQDNNSIINLLNSKNINNINNINNNENSMKNHSIIQKIIIRVYSLVIVIY